MRKDMILIASADKNWGIGKDNKLLKRIPEDLKRFSGLTTDNIIIVGRKTLESFKDKKPLPNRINIVLTRSEDYTCDGAIVVNSLDELEKELLKYNKKVYVCGGTSIYNQLIMYCKEALITQIDEEFEADSYLVNLDTLSGWNKVSEGEWQESSSGVSFRYVDYSFNEN